MVVHTPWRWLGALALLTVAPCAAWAKPAAPAAKAAAKPAALAMKDASALFQQTPARVEVASANETQVLMTNAFTLERRNVQSLPDVRALGFAASGDTLYAFTASGDWHAIDPDKASSVLLGKVPLQDGEVVVDTLPVAGADGQHAIGVVLARAADGGQSCQSALRLLALRRVESGPVTAQPLALKPRSERLVAGAPNTRHTAAAQQGALQLTGHFGAGSGKASSAPLPAGLFRITWQRDSQGLVGLYRRPAQGACKDRLGARVWRREASGWQEWTLPDDLELVRGDVMQQEPQLAPDGQRMVAWNGGGVFLVEPAARFRGHLGQIAPASQVVAKIRPGVRPLATRYQGYARVVEQLLETGDLDAAEAQLAYVPPVDKQRPALQARLVKLQEVRLRRAKEWSVALRSLRSDQSAPEPAAEPEPAPEPVPEPVPVPEPEP